MSVQPTAKPRCPVAFDHESADHARAWPDQFREIRSSECPLGWTDKHGGYWVATRYRDLLDIAQNAGVFSSHKDYDPATGVVTGGVSIPPFPTPRGIPIETDSPEWDQIRGFLNNQLSPKAVEARRPRTERFAAALIDRVIEKGEFDIVDDLTSPLPAITTMALFGLPLDEWRHFADPLHKMQFTPKEDPEFLPTVVNGIAWIRARMEEVVALRRKDPKDDLLSYLAHGEVNGKKLDDGTIWEIAWNLVVGGVDTTTALTSNTLIHLAAHPEQRAKLIADPGALPIAREEFVRFFSPVHGMARNALSEADVNGQTVEQGERVYLAFSAANRDPDIFDDPDTVKIDRFPNRHVGFGAGKHRCIGSFLARMMFETMIREVLTRMPDYRIVAGAAEKYTSVGTINGWVSVPAVFTPGRKVGAIIE
jgi:cytochrome P450